MMFKPDMLRAIRCGNKTVTRRLIKIDHLGWLKCDNHQWCFLHKDAGEHRIFKPRYYPGEIVDIKEAWATEKRYDHLKPRDIPRTAKIFYVSDGVGDWPINLTIGKLRSPLFFMEWMARTFIQIMNVRLERLQEITPEDALKEGMPPEGTEKPNGYQAYDNPIEEYAQLWDSINKAFPWTSNPYVWRIQFIKVDEPVGMAIRI